MFFICAIWMSKQVFTMVSHLFQHLRFFHFNTTHFNGARGIQTMEWIVLTCFNIDQRESRSKGHFTLVSAVIASPWDWTNDQRSKNSSLLRLKLFGSSWKLSMLFGSFNGENPMLGFFPLHDLEKKQSLT